MRLMWTTLIVIAFCGDLGCQAAPGAQGVHAPRQGWRKGRKAPALKGLGTWYGKPFHGRRTASGRVFDMNLLTAAHKRLPFGTMVEVSNLQNQRKVVVRITDRGPFGKGRIIDLSRAAAGRLGMLRAGVVQVRLKVLKWGDNRRYFRRVGRRRRAPRRRRRRRKAKQSRPSAVSHRPRARTKRPSPRRRARRSQRGRRGRGPGPRRDRK